MTNPFLSMKAIDKSFGKVRALEKAEFHLKKGEVHALLGVNGAGKSTLMKILSGVYEQDTGEVLLEGEKIRIRTPKAAKELGIFCVYQEVDTAIVSELSVAENILLDSIATGTNVFISKQKLHNQARNALLQLQADDIPIEKPAFMLSLAEKQLVLIARALVSSAKVIIFDEPTAPLSLHESTKLFSVINKLKAKGVGCIFISHRLPEVFEICDRITVMREGSLVGTYNTSDTNQEKIIESMLGVSYSLDVSTRTHLRGNITSCKRVIGWKKGEEYLFSCVTRRNCWSSWTGRCWQNRVSKNVIWIFSTYCGKYRDFRRNSKSKASEGRDKCRNGSYT